jgi:hypothetical protein
MKEPVIAPVESLIVTPDKFGVATSIFVVPPPPVPKVVPELATPPMLIVLAAGSVASEITVTLPLAPEPCPLSAYLYSAW